VAKVNVRFRQREREGGEGGGGKKLHGTVGRPKVDQTLRARQKNQRPTAEARPVTSDVGVARFPSKRPGQSSNLARATPATFSYGRRHRRHRQLNGQTHTRWGIQALSEQPTYAGARQPGENEPVRPGRTLNATGQEQVRSPLQQPPRRALRETSNLRRGCGCGLAECRYGPRPWGTVKFGLMAAPTAGRRLELRPAIHDANIFSAPHQARPNYQLAWSHLQAP